jgi:hypothetical protein
MQFVSFSVILTKSPNSPNCWGEIMVTPVFWGQPIFFHSSSSPGQLLVRAFAGDALPDLLKGSPAVGFWGRMLKKRAEE